MDYEQILYDVSGHVATITLNRPERLNAWTGTMARELREAMHRAAEDDAVRVIVLTGAGRGFCAGADMEVLGAAGRRPSGQTQRGPQEAEREEPPRFTGSARPDFHHAYSYLIAVPKPIIAAINGPVAGIALVLALYCDLRFAAASAVFTTAFARRGLVAEHGAAWLLPRLVGQAHALDLLLSGRRIDAAEAERIGLVNRTLPDAEFRDFVAAYARDLAELCSPRSVRVMKREVYEAMVQSLDEAATASEADMKDSLASEDFREGVAHFVEKRAPAFTGR